MKNSITEYDNALFINDYRVPYVIKDSVKVDQDSMQVTITIAISDYLRIHKQKEPVEVYKFDDNLPE
ncbi:hypothetical protein ACVRZR_06150 [Streptococcus entericus]|uniref:hypothetical protein n=1 Tax=Streptococcus entericus TaxID=155680 RepID=UPI0003730BF3|nr:hypothetical protein [Streptococcus entericus]